MENHVGFEAIRSLYLAKVEQLERLESRMDEGERRVLATIEPGQAFTSTYVIRFLRGRFEPQKYQVGIDIVYDDSSPDGPQATGASAAVQISPYPSSLSLIAICSSLLGVLLQRALLGSEAPLSDLSNMLIGGRILVAPAVALIFFNGYEYTALGKNLPMTLSWRSALLIGALCGLAQDRILAALKALIGS